MTVHFIGAGPGAADLLTLRAVRLLSQSATCLYAGTYLDEAVLGHCPDGADLIDTQHLNLDAIVGHMQAANSRGEDVARLCSGDPSVYSAIAEQTRRLDAAGIPWDVTPGVASYAATAAGGGRDEVPAASISQDHCCKRIIGRQLRSHEAMLAQNGEPSGENVTLQQGVDDHGRHPWLVTET